MRIARGGGLGGRAAEGGVGEGTNQGEIGNFMAEAGSEGAGRTDRSKTNSSVDNGRTPVRCRKAGSRRCGRAWESAGSRKGGRPGEHVKRGLLWFEVLWE